MQRKAGHYQPKFRLHYLSTALWTQTTSVMAESEGGGCNALVVHLPSTKTDSLYGCITVNRNMVSKVPRLACQREHEGTDVLVDDVICTLMCKFFDLKISPDPYKCDWRKNVSNRTSQETSILKKGIVQSTYWGLSLKTLVSYGSSSKQTNAC